MVCVPNTHISSAHAMKLTEISKSGFFKLFLSPMIIHIIIEKLCPQIYVRLRELYAVVSALASMLFGPGAMQSTSPSSFHQ